MLPDGSPPHSIPVPTMPDGDSPSLPSSAPVDLLPCPICQLLIPQPAFDDHLRLEHRLYTYRDVRRSLDDTVDALLEDLFSSPPSQIAWQTFVQLARSEFGPEALRFLHERLTRALSKLLPHQQDPVASALAPLIAPGNLDLILALAYSQAYPPRLLALYCLPHLQPPFNRFVRRALREILPDPSLPPAARFEALVHALPYLNDERATKLLVHILTGRRRRSSLDLIYQLEKRLGLLPVLERFREKLEDRILMSCPRCGIELRRLRMVVHLWQQHQLVLDGTRVRDPWNVVEEWLITARTTGESHYVERARIAAEKIDPQQGQNHLTRLLLVHGLAEVSTRHAVLQEARRKHASCCPHCFSFVPVPPEMPPLTIRFRSDRLFASGYQVVLHEHGYWPYLEVSSPSGVLFQGREPDRPWTASGAAALYSGILVLASLLLAMLWPVTLTAPWKPVLLLLFLAWLVYLGVKLAYHSEETCKERLLEFTWRFLVPELHSGGFLRSDSAFLAGLATWHSRHGNYNVPVQQLESFRLKTVEAVLRGEAPPGHLARLVRLQIEVAADEGEDPVPLVVRHIDRCFQGKLPLTFAQHLLEDWAADWWSTVNLARLRVLLCDRAFDAGFEVQTLLDAGHNAPALGTVLKIEAPRSLAALRLLWSLRATRPWDRLGDVRTAFELAPVPSLSKAFAEHPDLLLFQEDLSIEVVSLIGREGPAPARIQLTLAGLWLQQIIFSIPPRVFEVKSRMFGCELILGSQMFRSTRDLEPLARRLEKWFRWVFHEFLPQVDPVLNWRSPHQAALLRAWGAVPCPDCAKFLLPAVGEVGIPLLEPNDPVQQRS